MYGKSLLTGPDGFLNIDLAIKPKNLIVLLALGYIIYLHFYVSLLGQDITRKR